VSLRALAALALVLALAGCGGGDEPAAAPAAPEVTDVRNVLDLRAAFEADAGRTRLLVLVSPT
jgi:ABC-type glycerol-3-phosphate transport system substrate-binding protein